MNKKGLSPVIATVLLIALVIILAMIIFLWFRGFTNESILKFGKNIQLTCEDVEFRSSYDEIKKELSILNDGDVPIYRMKINVRGEGESDTSDLSGFSGLSNGGSVVLDMGNSFSDASEITLIPVLRGNSDKGQADYVCDNKGYKIELD